MIKQKSKNKDLIKKMIKKQFLITLSTTFFLIFVLIGSSYALLNTKTETGLSDVVVRSGNLVASILSEEDEIIEMNYTTLGVTDEVGLTYDPYTFTVQNMGETTIPYYELRIVDKEHELSTMPHKSLNFAISKNNSEYSTPKNLGDSGSYIFIGGSLAPQASDNFNLKLWVNEQFGKYSNNKTLKAAIELTLYSDVPTRNYIIYDTQGGSYVPKSNVAAKRVTNHIPVKKGCTFIGWSNTPDGDILYEPSALYEENNGTILYAIWAEWTTIEDIFITDVVRVSNVDADLSDFTTLSFTNNIMQDTVSLSSTNNLSQITYKVTVYNGSKNDVLFTEIYHTPMPDMHINDNDDIIVEVVDDGVPISSKTDKDFYVTLKYRNDLENITNNTVNAALNFRFKDVVKIMYLGFDDISDFPTMIPKGDVLTIPFGSGMEFINIIKDGKVLVNDRDFAFTNNTLTYTPNTGGIMEISAENNHPIKDRFPVTNVPVNAAFELQEGEFYSYNPNNATIYLEVDQTNITTFGSLDNIISIGTDIEEWKPLNNAGINFHMYYPDSNGNIVISPLYSPSTHLQFTVTADHSSNKIGKFAINANGFYFNGNLIASSSGVNPAFANVFSHPGGMTDNEYLAEFFRQFSNDLQVKIGSKEGVNRSNAIYNELIIFNEKLSNEDMIKLTEVNELIRTDFNTTSLLNPANPIVKNQPFKVWENGDFNISTQTLLVEMDVSGIVYANENLLSIGKELSGWIPTNAGNAVLHFYYSSNRNLIAAPLVNGKYQKQYVKTLTLLDDKYVKIAFSAAGVFVNGEKMFDKISFGPNISNVTGDSIANDSGYLTSFFTPWLNGNYNIDIGSLQGTARSNVDYIKLEMYDISMSAAEMAYYTESH